MITIKETTYDDIMNIQSLWADADVMKYIWPGGLQETLEGVREWVDREILKRPMGNHYSIEEAFRNGAEILWVDPHPANSKALALYERLGFVRKDMPAHVIAMGEDPNVFAYMELRKEKEI